MTMTRSQKQAQKQLEKRRAEQSTRPRCKVCGKPFLARAWDSETGQIKNPVTRTIQKHQQCAPAEWQRAYWRLQHWGKIKSKPKKKK